jgi:hypothetical protein
MHEEESQKVLASQLPIHQCCMACNEQNMYICPEAAAAGKKNWLFPTTPVPKK